MPLFGNTFLDEPLPKDGYLVLTDKPGFGVTLNRKGLNLKRPYTRYGSVGDAPLSIGNVACLTTLRWGAGIIWPAGTVLALP